MLYSWVQQNFNIPPGQLTEGTIERGHKNIKLCKVSFSWYCHVIKHICTKKHKPTYTFIGTDTQTHLHTHKWLHKNIYIINHT